MLQSVKETQSIVNAVQGGLNQRIESIAVKVGLLERQLPDFRETDGLIAASARLRLRPAEPDDSAR